MPDLDEIRDTVEKVAAGEPSIVGVYLFGSRATGEAAEGSDVDLGVLFDRRTSLRDVVRLERRFEEALGRSVDLVNAGSANAFLALDVVRGERLYEADPVACDEFDLYVLRRAGDLAPFERQRRRMLLGRGAARESAS